MSHELQQLIAFLVLMSPVIIVHFSMKTAEKVMIEKGNEAPSNAFKPEDSYGRGQLEKVEYDKLKSLRNWIILPNLLVAVSSVLFTSFLPI